MSLVWGYLGYMAATAIFSAIIARRAARRAVMAGSTHYRVCLIFAWYDFWIGCFYDRKSHRVFVFPIPMLGVCVDYDAPPLGD